MIPENINIDKDLLLEAINQGFDLFDIELGPLEEYAEGKYKLVKNPCYNDTKASVGVWKWHERNIWWYKDQGNPEFSGDCFSLVKKIKGDEWFAEHRFPGVLKYIVERCGVDPEKVRKRTWREQKLKDREDAHAKANAYKKDFHEYAGQFSWTEKVIADCGVTIEEASPIEKMRGSSTFLIVYNGDGFRKLYRPWPKKFWYEGTKPFEYWFGEKWIKELVDTQNVSHEVLLLVGGEKDVLSATSAGYHAISLNSETSMQLPETLMSIISKFKKCVVLYDRDKTGIDSMLKLCAKYTELVPCILPKELTDAGGKDISDYVSMKMDMNKIALLIDNASRNEIKQIEEVLAEMKSDDISEQFEEPPVEKRELPTVGNTYKKEAASKPPFSLAEMRARAESKNQVLNLIELGASDEVHAPELITEPTLSNADITIDEGKYQVANDNSSPCIDNRLYVKLPLFFQKLMRHFTDLHSRDIAFLSVLVTISAVLFRFRGIYGGRFMGTNLFGFISAPAGSGKGAAIYSRFLVTGINQKIKAQYQKDMAYFEAESKANPALEEPLPRMLLIPGNSSCAAIYNVLGGNENFGLLHETEADTISASFKNDWANYDDLLRKAAMHEPISSNRVNRTLSVERPSLSVLLTGTPNQIASLIPSAENGLFSRFLYYKKSGRDSWMNQFEESQEDLEGRFKKYGEEVTQWWDRQQAFESDITIKLSKEQQDKTNKYFSQKLMELQELFDIDIDASVKRYGLLHFRICMILTAIRTLGEGSDIGNCIVVSDIDFESSLIIMDCLFKHLSVVFTKLKRAEKNRVMDVQSILSVDQLKLFNALPNEFEKKDADHLSLSLGLSSNCHKMLDKYLKHNLIKKIGHGKYQKNDEYED